MGRPAGTSQVAGAGLQGHQCWERRLSAVQGCGHCPGDADGGASGGQRRGLQARAGRQTLARGGVDADGKESRLCDQQQPRMGVGRPWRPRQPGAPWGRISALQGACCPPSPPHPGTGSLSCALGGRASPLSTCSVAPRHPHSGAMGTPWWPLTATSMCLGVPRTIHCPTSCTAMMWTSRRGRSSSPAQTAR